VGERRLVRAPPLVGWQLVEQFLELVTQQMVQLEPTGAIRSLHGDQEGIVAPQTLEKLLTGISPKQRRAHSMIEALYDRQPRQRVDVGQRPVRQHMLIEVAAEVICIANTALQVNLRAGTPVAKGQRHEVKAGSPSVRHVMQGAGIANRQAEVLREEQFLCLRDAEAQVAEAELQQFTLIAQPSQ